MCISFIMYCWSVLLLRYILLRKRNIKTVKNTNNKKTVSAKDTSVYSISVSQSKNKINHLIIKHNTYFSALTFMTSQKDEYVFSSK